jgi:hypothetical protein
MNSPYRFRFYRSVTNAAGRPFESTVEVVEIRQAKTPERAREAAIRRFVRHQQLSRWDCLATGYELSRPQKPTAL